MTDRFVQANYLKSLLQDVDIVTNNIDQDLKFVINHKDPDLEVIDVMTTRQDMVTITCKDLVATTYKDLVAAGANNGTITVELSDGKKYLAKLIGRDNSYDLAVLKIDVTSAPTLQFGNSDQVQVGDAVIAIGSPLGLSGTVTTGIINQNYFSDTKNINSISESK